MSRQITLRATADELNALQRMLILGNRLWAGGQEDPRENHPDFEMAAKVCQAICIGYTIAPLDEKQHGN